MKKLVMSAIVALVIGCGPDALKMYADTADSIVDEANRYETELAQVCEAAGLRAVAEGDNEGALLIESKCHQAWAAFGEFKIAHAKLARAISDAQLDQSKLPLVLVALSEMAEASKRWANAVEALRKELV